MEGLGYGPGRGEPARFSTAFLIPQLARVLPHAPFRPRHSAFMSWLGVSGFEKSYLVGTQKLKVLRGLELSVERGEMVAIVGASGVGKSTLLHVLGGLDAVDAGSVRM